MLETAVKGNSVVVPTPHINKRILRLQLYALLLAADCASILVAFAIPGFARGASWAHSYMVNLTLAVLPIYVIFAFNSEAYTKAAVSRASISVKRGLQALALTMLTILTFTFFLQAGEHVSRIELGVGALFSAIFITSHRALLSRFVHRVLGNRLVSEVLIVDGVNVRPMRDVDVIYAEQAGIEVNINDPIMLNRLGDILHNYDRAIVACSPEKQADWALLLKGANIIGELMIRAIEGVHPIGINSVDGHNTVVVARGPLGLSARARKRALDLIFTVPLLILLTPLLLTIALAIKLDSPGSIFFRQMRIGRSNRVFHVLKFRSMRSDLCDARGAQSTQQHDDRITRVGRFIRRTSIDELPQLINVLLGDMSIVGPRPHALGSLAGDRLFWEVDPQYWNRHALKPGITGLAQVRGFRGATDTQEDLINRLNADLEYLNDWSILRDISILFRTLLVVVHKNAY